MNQNNTDADELLRTARTNLNKALHLIGESDGTADDGEPASFFVVHRGGNFGWAMYRKTGESYDYHLTDENVEESIEEYDHIEVVDVSEIPDAAGLSPRSIRREDWIESFKEGYEIGYSEQRCNMTNRHDDVTDARPDASFEAVEAAQAGYEHGLLRGFPDASEIYVEKAANMAYNRSET